QLLPQYEGWIDGTLEGDSGRQDEVIVTLMIWAIDAGDYPLAARIGRYVIAHDLSMPDRFRRTAATLLVEELCDPILVQVKADDTTDISIHLPVLDEITQIVDGKDMPDEVRAKLLKTHAYALRSGNKTDQVTALGLLRKAMKLDAGAHVKRDIEVLARLVKKSSQSDVTEGDGDASAESGADSDLGGADNNGTTADTSVTTGENIAATSKATTPAVKNSKAKTRKPADKATAKKATNRRPPAKKTEQESTE
ncbi:MAG: phage terminase small subunit, partial [Chania sp.]